MPRGLVALRLILLLGGLWASLLLEPTILIGLLVGLGAALLFFLVLGALLDRWLTRRMEHQER
jgi:hypothetical protein